MKKKDAILWLDCHPSSSFNLHLNPISVQVEFCGGNIINKREMSQSLSDIPYKKLTTNAPYIYIRPSPIINEHGNW
jgi:hypothetical protein